jgi:hypothetical protein
MNEATLMDDYLRIPDEGKNPSIPSHMGSSCRVEKNLTPSSNTNQRYMPVIKHYCVEVQVPAFIAIPGSSFYFLDPTFPIVFCSDGSDVL